MTTTYKRKLNLGSLDYAPDVQIRIRPSGITFEMDCHIGASPLRLPIDLSIFDMNDMAHGLQARLEDVREVFEDEASDEDERDEVLRALAEKGRAAFLRVFGSKGLNERLTKTLLTQKALIVQFTSEEFSIPWDLLYLRDLAQPVLLKCFLGLRHIVSRIVVLNDGSDMPADHLIKAKTPAMGVLSNLDLDLLVKRELPFFRQQATDNIITLHHLDKELDPGDKNEFKHLRRFLNRRYHILHFACHADYVQGLGPKFVITRNFDVSLDDLICYECNVQGNPVVFLNACRSSDVEPTYFNSLARHFLGKGARALIATECTVPDGFAGRLLGIGLLAVLKMHTPRRVCVRGKASVPKQGQPVGFGLFVLWTAQRLH